MSPCIKPTRRQRGLTLVELLVALVIGLILMVGAAQLFVANKVTFKTQEGVSRIQENGRYAVQRIGRSARNAGYFGCAGPNLEIDVIANNAPADFVPFNDNPGVDGLDNVAAGNIYNAAPNTDVLVLRGSGLSGIGMTGAAMSNSDDVQIVMTTMNIAQNDLLIINDCRLATMFRASAVDILGGVTTVEHDATTNSSADFKMPLQGDATVLHPYVHVYFVRDTGRDNASGHDIFALYRQDPSGVASELVEGVSDMQVLYGVNSAWTQANGADSSGNVTADYFTDAGSVPQWSRVVSVRVSLLVDSIENTLEERTDYQFSPAGAAPITPAAADDFRMRQEFTSYFSVRNRSL